MAIIYVDDAAVGLNDGTSWTDAYTSLNNAGVDGAAADSDILVASTHNESLGGSLTLAFTGGTAAIPIRVISASTADDSYTIGAKFATGSAGADLNVSGHVHMYGMEFDVNDDTRLGSGNDLHQWYEDCVFTLGDVFNPSDSQESNSTFVSCTFTSTDSAAGIYVDSIESGATFKNCTFTHSSANLVTFISSPSSENWQGVFENCDLSASSTNLTVGIANAEGKTNVTFRRCKLKASWTALGGSSISLSKDAFVLVESCTDGTITVPELGMTQLDTYHGTAKTTLAKYRTGGADDGLQANAHSWEMAANANCLEMYNALESPPIALWAAADASISAATSRGLFQSTRIPINSNVSGTHTGASNASVLTDSTGTWPTNGLAGLSILNTTDGSEAVIISNTATTITATLSGGTDNDWDASDAYTISLTTDAISTWNGTGVGTKQKITATVGDYTLTVYVASGGTLNYDDFWIEVSAPNQVGGPVIVRFFLAKPSTTVYIDPRLEIA